MSANIFEVKAYISVKFSNSTPSFLVTPDQAYLSPCKKYALGFHFDLESAKLLKLDEEGKLNIQVDGNPDWLSHLVNIALAQKPVLLNIDENGKKITGFTFPAN